MRCRDIDGKSVVICRELRDVRQGGANAKCRRQNAKLGDGSNEAQTVGDDVPASQITKSGNQRYGSNEAQTVGAIHELPAAIQSQ